MAKIFPIRPAHPERICWGCDLYCPADDMRCGNGSDRTQHPFELLGEDWHGWDSNAGDAPPALLDSSQTLAPDRNTSHASKG